MDVAHASTLLYWNKLIMTLQLTEEERKYLVNCLDDNLENEEGYRGYVDDLYDGEDQTGIEKDFRTARSILNKLLQLEKPVS